MSKFKEGDTVYIKGVLIKDDNSNIPYRVALEDNSTFWASSEDVLTKEEMLAELNKPELPQLGEVWKWKCDGDKVKIVYISKINVAYEYLANKSISACSLDSFYKNLTKVEK